LLNIRTMKILIPVLMGRISPVFDVARRLLLVAVAEDGGEISRKELRVEETDELARARHIARLGAHVLICGAISRSLESRLAGCGIWIIPNTCGPAEQVLRAFVTREFGPRSFLMPGCHGQRRHRGRGSNQLHRHMHRHKRAGGSGRRRPRRR
jgi:predicted Fe-Mo cluster-binding NifX family protein